MSGDGICDLRGSEGLSTLYRRGEPLVRSHCVKLAFCVLSAALPFSLLSNALRSDRLGRSEGLTSQEIALELLALPETPLLLGATLLLGSLITAWMLISVVEDRTWPGGIREATAFGICYPALVVLTRLLVVGDPPTLSSVGLSVVHASALLLVARRLTAPLIPTLLTRADHELYLDNQRHVDRMVLTIGLGLILTVLLAVAPTGSAPLPRFTAVLLSGPLGIALLGFLGLGVLRIRRLEASILLRPE